MAWMTALCACRRAAGAAGRRRRPQDHVFRNHSVGSRCSAARSGPRLYAVMRTSKSSGAAFAYSTKTSKYRSSLNTPVSISSYSSSVRPRRAFVCDQVHVGEGGLRILVQVPHVRMRRRAVEVEVVLLDVLAVVALTVGQAEEALLEDRVLAVPERERETEELAVVGDAGECRLRPSRRLSTATGRG